MFLAPSMASVSSSSSSVQTKGWKYDVFLSFRGEDVRNTFVDHLFAALVQKGIHTFKDDKMLGGGKPISQELIEAIKESTLAIIVFSKNYANSSWCLDELAKIMECHDQKAFPVFYHVDPSDVRRQKGDFATAFQEHEENFKGEMDKVRRWRRALTGAANLSGCHITKDRPESEFINKIIEYILGELPARGRETGLIGIESSMVELSSLLRIEATQEVRIIGIVGMGGIGKTTIAQALFRRIAHRFEGSSFIMDVREKGSSETAICDFQKKILRDILHHEPSIEDRFYGADLIEDRLCDKNVLLVLDNVDKSEQLEYLAKREWFGPGSRIVITTRDEHLLLDANAIYKPALLPMDQAIELFNMHAFPNSTRPPDEYTELSKRATKYADRLPLALKVLGGFLRGRNVGAWESALDKLAKIPNPDIFRTLKLSFDDLDDDCQTIFLDIACLFKGESKKDAVLRLDSCGFHSDIGIDILIEKSLITISSDQYQDQRLGMHDLIQEMGWEIVRKNFPKSRLRNLEEIDDCISENREINEIEAIVMNRLEPCNLRFSPEVFESMKKLRILEVSEYFTSSQPTLLPHVLRWLQWSYCPFSSLPLANLRKLAGIDYVGGEIKSLWNGQQVMQNLKYIRLFYLPNLRSFPDVSGAPNIETLRLYDCQNLVEVHESVGSLRKLVCLEIMGCDSLKCLPFRFEMESLRTLELRNKVLELPESIYELKGLKEFYFNGSWQKI